MENRRPLANRLDGVSESATLKLNAAAQAMQAQGIDVVNLTAGEPDFFVPDVAKEAVAEAIRQNKSKYTPVAGIPELRSLIAEKTNRQQPSLSAKSPWKPTDVVVTNGGKQSIFNAMMALLNPGDEVIIPAPYWLSYPEIARLMGGVSKVIDAPLEQGFRITPAQLKQAITAKSKLLILNSPSNPTGSVYSKAEFRALGDVILNAPEAKGMWILSDEIYDLMTFGDRPFCSFLEACPELRDRTMTSNGLSKSAAMTGWRVGWAVAPAPLLGALSLLQGQSTSGISALSQAAAVAALKLSEKDFLPQVQALQTKLKVGLEELAKTKRLEAFEPGGAFYIFVRVKNALQPGEDSFGFCERLLEKAKVAAVPGTPFGAPDYVRLSFATSEARLREGCRRIVAFVEDSG